MVASIVSPDTLLAWHRHLIARKYEFEAHYHCERNHQGLGNVLIFPTGIQMQSSDRVLCRERLGGLLKYYTDRPRREQPRIGPDDHSEAAAICQRATAGAIPAIDHA